MPSARHPRFILGTATLIGALLALSGCVKSELSLTVNPDDTVSGVVILGIEKGFLASPDRTQDEAIEETFDSFEVDPTADIPGSTGAQPYEDDKYAGRQSEFTNASFEEFSSRQIQERPFSLAHTDGRYEFSMTVDLREHPNLDDDIRAAMELQVSVTFPVPVAESNGSVADDGTTVHWNLDGTKENKLTAIAEEQAVEEPAESPADTATGQAASLQGSSWYGDTQAMVVMIVAPVALILVLVLLWTILRRWRGNAAAPVLAAQPVPNAGTAPPQWPGSADATQEIPIVPPREGN